MNASDTPPRVGSEPEWLGRKERGSQLAIRAYVWLALTLGRSLARLCLAPVCMYFMLFAPDSRRASRAYLARVQTSVVTWRHIYRHIHSFASCALDRVFFLQNRIDLFDVQIHGADIVDDILARGSGCILLGAHIGSFEALRAVGRDRASLRINMLMFDDNARKVNSVLNAIDPALAKEIIALGRPDSFVRMQQCLERGHFVGVLADRSLSDERRIACDFLGARARFSVNPFRIFAILNVPVVFMVALYRGDNRYEVHFEQFADALSSPQRPSAAEIEAMLARYIARLEHHCRHAPYNWFNFFDVWR